MGLRTVSFPSNSLLCECLVIYHIIWYYYIDESQSGQDWLP